MSSSCLAIEVDNQWTIIRLRPMNTQGRQPRHPIAVVAERTGLSQDVLRVWERRYAAVVPSRGPGGQRLYSDDDVERLRLMHVTSRAGRSIAQIASLSTEALSQLAAEDAAARPLRAELVEADRASVVLDATLQHAKALESTELASELRRAAAALGLSAFIEDVAAPLMRRIGDEWHSGWLSIAQEHVATAVLRDLLLEMMRGFATPAGADCMVVATPAGERHEIGAAIAGAAAAARGWHVVYLGADLPAAEIVAAARSAQASVVALSIVYAEERGRLLDEVGQVRQALSPGVRVIVGGAGARTMGAALRATGVEVVHRADPPRFD